VGLAGQRERLCRRDDPDVLHGLEGVRVGVLGRHGCGELENGKRGSRRWRLEGRRVVTVRRVVVRRELTKVEDGYWHWQNEMHNKVPALSRGPKLGALGTQCGTLR